MATYELSEPSDRFVVARSQQSATGSVLEAAAVVVLGLPAVLWVLWWIATELFEPTPLLRVAMAVAGIGIAGAAVFALRRIYGSSRQREILVLDRANDSVTKDGRKVCALAEIDRVELRGGTYESHGALVNVYKVGLVVAGPRGRGAPRSAVPSANDVIAVVDSTDQTEMRACARRMAGFAGVAVEEIGT